MIALFVQVLISLLAGVLGYEVADWQQRKKRAREARVRILMAAAREKADSELRSVMAARHGEVMLSAAHKQANACCTCPLAHDLAAAQLPGNHHVPSCPMMRNGSARRPDA